MKILIINYEFPPLGGGGGEGSKNLAKHYVRLGHEVQVLTAHYHGLPHHEMIDGYQVYRTPSGRKAKDHCTKWQMLQFFLRNISPALRLAREFRPQVTHIHFVIPVGPLGYLIYRKYKIPYIITCRGGDVPATRQVGWLYDLIRPVLYPVVRHAARLAAVSRNLAGLARQSFWSLPVEYIPNGVDSQFFAPGDVEPSAECDVVRLLFVGRISEQKGLPTLIDALEAARRQCHRAFMLDIYGDGPLKAKLSRQINEKGLQDIVRLHGWVTRDELRMVYRGADAFVLPSYSEGLPMACLEAMASGLAVVATRVGGTPEVVKDDENGILVDPHDHNQLADALVRIITDPALRRSYGACSRRIAETEFSWETVARQYLDLLEQVVASQKKN